MATPYVTVVRNAVTSTQDIAAEMLQTSSVPVLVIAANQSAGRGRIGNEWWQATHAVAASLAIPNDLFAIDDTFSLAVGQAVRSSIAEVLSVVVDLKWPNDLMLAGQKVGGVLVERNGERSVVGCGLNLYWPDAPEGAGSIVDVDPGETAGRAISEGWAAAVLESKGRWNRDDYLQACSTIGAEVTWQPSGYGTVVTVDELGGLVVATESGEVILRSGEVSTIRRAG